MGRTDRVTGMTPSESRFVSLYEGYEPRLYAYCRRRFSADAVDDVLADVMLTIWRKIEDAPDDVDVLPWLYRIAYLVCSNHRRGFTRRKRLATRLESLGLESRPTVVDQIVVRDEVRRALAVLESLPDGQREIIKLSVWEHLSATDIGSVLEITPEAAAQRLYRARKRLTKEVQRRINNGNISSPAARQEVSGEH